MTGDAPALYVVKDADVPQPLTEEDLRRIMAEAMAGPPPGGPAGSGTRPPRATDRINDALEGGRNLLYFVVLIVGLAGWAFNLQGMVKAVAEDITEVKAAQRELAAKVDTGTYDRWTRDDHAAYHRDEIKPLIERMRKLEAVNADR